MAVVGVPSRALDHKRSHRTIHNADNLIETLHLGEWSESILVPIFKLAYKKCASYQCDGHPVL